MSHVFCVQVNVLFSSTFYLYIFFFELEVNTTNKCNLNFELLELFLINAQPRTVGGLLKKRRLKQRGIYETFSKLRGMFIGVWHLKEPDRLFDKVWHAKYIHNI